MTKIAYTCVNRIRMYAGPVYCVQYYWVRL